MSWCSSCFFWLDSNSCINLKKKNDYTRDIQKKSMKTREAPIYQSIQYKFDNSIPMSSRIQPYPKTTSKTSISLTAVSTGSEFIEGLAIGIGAEGQIAGLEWSAGGCEFPSLQGCFFRFQIVPSFFFPRSLLTVPIAFDVESIWKFKSR